MSSSLRPSLRILPLAAAFVLAACPSKEPGEEDPVPPNGDQPSVSVECARGFEAAQEHPGCVPVLPSEDCPAGTRPSLGSTDCVPAAWSACPEGFQLDESGWGCSGVLTESTCSGHMRPLPGSTECVSVGECAEVWPPPDADIIVDASFTDEDLGDTRFRTISAALLGAPAGATIAVSPGEYSESLAPRRPLRIVGRCASEVTVKGSGTSPGLLVSGVRGVEVSGLTLRDHLIGVVVEYGGELDISATLVDSNVDLGVAAWTQGSALRASDVLVRDTRPDAQGHYGWSVFIVEGAEAVFHRSAVLGGRDVGVVAAGAGAGGDFTRVEIFDSVIGHQTAAPVFGVQGSGITAQEGASVHAERTVVTHAAGMGLLAFARGPGGKQPTITMLDSVIEGTVPSGGEGYGVSADDGGHVVLERVAVVGSTTAGIALLEGGSLEGSEVLVRDTRQTSARMYGGALYALDEVSVTIEDFAFVDAFEHGVMADGEGAAVTLRRGVVRDIKAALDGAAGRGVAVQFGAAVEMEDVAILRAQEYALFVTDTAQGVPSYARLEGGLIADTVSAPRSERGGAAIGVQLSGEAEVLRSAIIRSTAVAAVVTDTLAEGSERLPSLHLEDSSILHTRPDAGGERGAGLVCGGTIGVHSTTVWDSYMAGLMLANPDASAEVRGSAIGGTRSQESDGLFGEGVVVLNGSHLELHESVVSGNESIGLAFERSTARVGSSLVERNAVGIHAQAGSSLSTIPSLPDRSELGELEIALDDATAFLENDITVGSGTVPLPSLPTDL